MLPRKRFHSAMFVLGLLIGLAGIALLPNEPASDSAQASNSDPDPELPGRARAHE